MFDRSSGVCAVVSMARNLSGLVAALPSLAGKFDRLNDNLGDLEEPLRGVHDKAAGVSLALHRLVDTVKSK